MKKMFIFWTLIFSLLLGQNYIFAQDEECCEEDDKYGRENEISENEWLSQMQTLNETKKGLNEKIAVESKELENLRISLLDKQNQISKAEENLYSSLGINKSGLEEFKKKFDETEKKILNRTGTPFDARKFYFNEIEASKAKCLPDYYNRYLTMKQKLEQWEKESAVTVKEGQYTVVKGDCLWKISGKKEIYGNPKFWPKIWDANKDGVISAPGTVQKKITNPNLIYPGQVLKILSLSDEDVVKLKSNTYLNKNMKEIFEEKDKERKKDKKKDKMKKKEYKKPKSLDKKDDVIKKIDKVDKKNGKIENKKR